MMTFSGPWPVKNSRQTRTAEPARMISRMSPRTGRGTFIKLQTYKGEQICCQKLAAYLSRRCRKGRPVQFPLADQQDTAFHPKGKGMPQRAVGMNRFVRHGRPSTGRV